MIPLADQRRQRPVLQADIIQGNGSRLLLQSRRFLRLCGYSRLLRSLLFCLRSYFFRGVLFLRFSQAGHHSAGPAERGFSGLFDALFIHCFFSGFRMLLRLCLVFCFRGDSRFPGSRRCRLAKRFSRKLLFRGFSRRCLRSFSFLFGLSSRFRRLLFFRIHFGSSPGLLRNPGAAASRVLEAEPVAEQPHEIVQRLPLGTPLIHLVFRQASQILEQH